MTSFRFLIISVLSYLVHRELILLLYVHASISLPGQQQYIAEVAEVLGKALPGLLFTKSSRCSRATVGSWLPTFQFEMQTTTLPSRYKCRRARDKNCICAHDIQALLPFVPAFRCQLP